MVSAFFAVLLFLEKLLLFVGGLGAALALGGLAKGEYEAASQHAALGAGVAFHVSLYAKGSSKVSTFVTHSLNI